MRKIVYTLLICCNTFIAYAQIKNDTTMIEKYDFEAAERKDFFRKRGDWVIEMSTIPCGSQNEYTPAKDFYMVQKQYHPNGVLKQKFQALGDVLFGERKIYDEQGKLIEVIDEDKKLGKIKPKDVIEIMEKIGWINRETGEAITAKEPLPTDGNFYRTLFYLSYERNLQINYSEAYYDEIEKKEYPRTWGVGHFIGTKLTQYLINGDTGEYEKKVSTHVMIE